MMISPSNTIIITDIGIPDFSISKEEVIALLEECKHSYISYNNPVARNLIKRMMDFVEKTNV